MQVVRGSRHRLIDSNAAVAILFLGHVGGLGVGSGGGSTRGVVRFAILRGVGSMLMELMFGRFGGDVASRRNILVIWDCMATCGGQVPTPTRGYIH